MEQHEHATGAGEVPGGTGIGRTGGAGRLLAPASRDAARPDAAPADAAHSADAARPVPAGPGAAFPSAAHLDTELLARRLAAADAEAAHDLFTEAFGLYGARHLGGLPESGCVVLADTSWWHGPTAHRSAALRARGGRPVGPRRVRSGSGGQNAPGGARSGGRHRKPDRSRGPGQAEADVERRTAARLLMAHPLVTADGPHGAGFPLIRRHADWLTDRFREVLGYPLTVAAGHARLRKAALPGRGLPGLDPEGYAALVLALAALAEGRPPEPEHPAVLRVLTGWQVLMADGTPDRELAAALAPGRPLPPAGPELTVRRLLAETPVVLLDELAPQQRTGLLAGRFADAELLADLLGLEAEVRSEGVALLDPAEELTDLALPGTGVPARAAVLLVGQLVEELRPLPEEAAPPAVLVPDALIDGALGDIVDDHGLRAGLGPEYLADRTALRREVLGLLDRMGLIARAGRGWVLRAPAARYAPEAELHPVPGSGRHSRPATPAAPGPARAREPYGLLG
ncbi:DUF2398 family protein [Kitasatospora camelliae]|uniref:DUF2398 family protein n=1 Tax=Kitasatospora camelliae TaxID=3156397 RepID=A0AAU8K4T6_9ACTN